MIAPTLLAQRATATAILVFFFVSLAQSASSFHPANTTTRPAVSGSCIPSERKALLTFKDSFWDRAGRLYSWRGEDCCRWKGVRCDNTTEHVVKLDLRNTDDWRYRLSLTTSEMSPSIVDLHHLRYLDLSNNDFNFTSIPDFLGSLSNLRYLNLSVANFGGTLPSQLGNLSNLQYLDLGHSYLSVSDLSWLMGLPFLSYLDLSTVDLSSERNWVHTVNKLPSLLVLILSECGVNSTVSTLSHSNLTHLEVLDLTSNWFSSPLARNWFWDLTTLKKLFLYDCAWSGPIPDALGNMSALESIDLHDTDLLGNIPTTMKNLCNLQELNLYNININSFISELMERLPKCSWNKLRKMDLHSANLTGELPTWIGNLASLSYLDLSENMIVGSVPDGMGNLTNLNYLDLSQNMLVGHLPVGMGQLTGLTFLDLSQNLLVGHIPVGIGAFGNLTSLNLGQNSFSGVLTEHHFAALERLEYLNLSRNSLKLDLHEAWIPPFKLTEGYFESCDLGPQFPSWLRWQTGIVFLDISNTSIKDDLPGWFWTILSNAYELYLSSNQLGGALPEKLELPSMQAMDLSDNYLSGKLPANLTVPNLMTLHLHHNQIGGTIPACLCQLRSLRVINLSYNQLTGEIPQCSVDQFGFSFLVIDMKNNNLSGEFPSFLQNAGWLLFLDLSYNKLSGNVPTWIAQRMPYLEVLILRSNMFCGNLSNQLNKLDQLHFLDVAHNNISGSIYSSIRSLTAMKYSHTSGLDNYTGASISMSIKDQELNYTFQSTNNIMLIDMSYNSFTGPIPRELTLLKGLQSLNLSGNQLSGTIPNDIGILRRLESLDLSYNDLVGEIPSSLSDLTFLSCLNLSYNNLSGRIPSGQQLQTLNNLYMYIGNPGLCGLPLSTNCSTNRTNKIVQNEHDDASHDTTYLYISTSAGFVVGLWIVFCTILFKKSWRIAYFQFFDQIYDKIYVQAAVSKAVLIRKFL